MNAPAVETIENPFSKAPVVARPDNDAMVATLSAREVAKVQTGMMMARRFPRDEVASMDRILQACTRPTLAEGALYEYARGGSDIRGPSIRLAECLAGYWGHIDCGWRVVEERPGATKIETYANDLQTGANWSITFDVVHERVARGSKQAISDPRDIYEHCANAASRRLRACILRVIPGDVVEAAVRQCERTLHTKVEVTPQLIADMLGQFAEIGVTKPQIEKRIQRRVDAMTPGMMVQLRKIFTSLRDGMSQPGDWFPAGPQAAQEGAGEASQTAEGGSPKTRTAAVKERMASRRPDPGPVADPGPAPSAAETLGTSVALRDVIKFARAAAGPEDIERANQIALMLTDEAEVLLAQEHLDTARQRLGVAVGAQP